MKSKWEPGTRVRVKTTVGDKTAGMTGVVEAVNYAHHEAATSVQLDGVDTALKGLGAFFYDNELEAE
ncbi:hypothetical protein [Streptomyces sp. NPDC014622]|uniref:hypothetical protein n=1 Tax=Streptomyces sp. NPDC014622 TaxID=3364874 RepID=UPI0036FFA342